MPKPLVTIIQERFGACLRNPARDDRLDTNGAALTRTMSERVGACLSHWRRKRGVERSMPGPGQVLAWRSCANRRGTRPRRLRPVTLSVDAEIGGNPSLTACLHSNMR